MKYRATYIRDILTTAPGNRNQEVFGWIKTKRESKKICFFELSDGSCLKNLQVVFDINSEKEQDIAHRLTTGTSVKVIGKLVASPGENQAVEMQAETLEIIGEAPAATYPLQKKRHSFEFLRDIAHLRPRTNTFGAIARVRNALSFAVHRFFQEKGFYYIHTPIITTSDCEGAGEMFQVTTLPLQKILSNTSKEIDYSQDFFGKKAGLTVSGQLEAEIYALALTNVYTFGPTFRAENSNTARHLSEFWMIEPEMAFCSLEGNIGVAVEFIKYLITYVLEHCSEDLDFFNTWVHKGVKETLQQVVESTFTEIFYGDAIEELKRSKKEFEFPVSWGSDLQSEHERYLTEEIFNGPVIVTNYPRTIKPFYMYLNDDGKTVRAMDVLVPRLGEIIGGSQREHRRDILEQRIKEQNLDPADYWWYLELRTYGTVPHAGFGLGFERLIQYVTGMQNIRDVIPFPRTVGNAEF